jgi:hypothetical protein
MQSGRTKNACVAPQRPSKEPLLEGASGDLRDVHSPELLCLLERSLDLMVSMDCAFAALPIRGVIAAYVMNKWGV